MTSILVPPVVFREAQPADQGFIFNSWLKSFRANSEWAHAMPAQIYYDNHKRVVAQLLHDSSVLVAANPDDPDQIFGYVVYQPTLGHVAVLHWLYVKHTYRRLGIGGEVFRTALRLAQHDDTLPVVGTHFTTLWSALADKWRLVFNPYVIGSISHGENPKAQAS